MAASGSSPSTYSVGSKGFTLLEILIAMAIFTMIGLASHSVLTTVLNSDDISSARTQKLEALQRAMLFIERDLLQAVPRAVRIEGENNDKVISGGSNQVGSEADGLLLVRAGWHNPQLMLPRSTLQPVAYRLVQGKLERVYTNYPDNVIGYEPKVKVLLEDIEDFQVQFLAPSTEQNSQNNWSESYVGSTLPKAIAIEIQSKDFGLIRREFLLASGAVAAPAAAEEN
ncbi:type II secretion system minor pseudopilin GspJ [Aliiglaciecola sp. CAU 1673]|uniref:type II secretion system minor pseudopilin GspJ n=1 Tax=Aliiglaciecola sp. CAU 1673 TaxID=3032595 RepID=UPI0023DB1C84|nr:type II secretion system minor pseudopilin GspJ [Aliiglaciecola sp. CAU 1673]MDF2179220.1 type II secretion system minor pseudopilin GspJ [Aliiglaciecola sp. CAU 1673]